MPSKMKQIETQRQKQSRITKQIELPFSLLPNLNLVNCQVLLFRVTVETLCPPAEHNAENCFLVSVTLVIFFFQCCECNFLSLLNPAQLQRTQRQKLRRCCYCCCFSCSCVLNRQILLKSYKIDKQNFNILEICLHKNLNEKIVSLV